MMMDVQLTTQVLLQRMRQMYPERPVVSLLVAGQDGAGKPVARTHRTTYGETARRAAQLGNALLAAGVQPGDRVATLAPNSYRHLETYLAVPGIGAVLHTVNLRLTPEQIVWIINDARDRILLLDPAMLALVPLIQAQCPTLEQIVLFSEDSIPAGLTGYEAFIAPHPDTQRWPELDERQAASLCYTSGTTGNPKGALFSHRALMLHAMGTAHAMGIQERDTVLPVVPMFHANTWGIAHYAPMYGAGLVFLGVFNDGGTIARVIQEEGVTVCMGVLTIMLALLEELDAARAAGQPIDTSRLRLLGCGGTPVPEALTRAMHARHGLFVLQAWGLTEVTTVGTVGGVPAQVDPTSDEGFTHRARQGRPLPFTELDLIDDDGLPVPHDGRSMGRLLIRGPWVIDGYYNVGRTRDFVEHEGRLWLDTGDIATLSPGQEVWIQDRAKDLVKSGGEWISSAEVENALMAHPQVAAAVVVAIAHEKWTERPLALVIPRGEAPSAQQLAAHLRDHVAKWWIPDDFIMVPELPIGSTGKFLKREIRDQYKGHRWSSAGSGSIAVPASGELTS